MYSKSIAALAVVAALAAPAARGHEGLRERMALLDGRLGVEGANAALLVERAELHRLRGDWLRALEDLRRAAQLDPVASEVELERARVYQSIGSLHAARACADSYLEREPRDAGALALRASVLIDLRQPADAVRDLERALQLTQMPTPDLILDRARAQIAAGCPEDALRGLEEWIARLGPTTPLVLQAVDLCVELGRIDDALARLDALVPHARRQETWLLRRAEILECAGRDEEARAALEAARCAVDELGEHHRKTRAVQELWSRIDAGLAQLAQRGNRP